MIKRHYKEILLASVFIAVTQHLSLLVAYLSSEDPNGVGGVCVYLYWFAIVPVYFVVRGFAKKKKLFWCVALGCHVLFSVLTHWEINMLDKGGYLTWLEPLEYMLSWLIMVCIVGGALLLDLIISAIARLIVRIMKRFQKWANEPEGAVQ